MPWKNAQAPGYTIEQTSFMFEVRSEMIDKLAALGFDPR